MAHPVVDLRSDTVTKPTREMRLAMAEAEVGDDGEGEDPTINELEAEVASLLGKQAAVYVPSGVMANQVALRVLTRPGDVVIAGAEQHVVEFEMGAAGRNAGIQFRTLDDSRGPLELDDLSRAFEAEHHHHSVATAVFLENTHMASGGTPIDPEHVGAIADMAGERAIHLDGARLFNAACALEVEPSVLCARARTVMITLTKGLCAPVGSVLCGSAEDIAVARTERKRLGGAMRQAGVIAAAGLVAIRTMRARLVEDHVRARRLAEAVADTVAPDFDPQRCRTNIVAFAHPDAAQLVVELRSRGVLCNTVGPGRVRLVTHHDVDDEGLEHAIRALREIAEG